MWPFFRAVDVALDEALPLQVLQGRARPNTQSTVHHAFFTQVGRIVVPNCESLQNVEDLMLVQTSSRSPTREPGGDPAALGCKRQRCQRDDREG